jgi:type III restriction enzyme
MAQPSTMIVTTCLVNHEQLRSGRTDSEYALRGAGAALVYPGGGATGTARRRRPAVVFTPRDQKAPWVPSAILQPSREYAGGFELALVNLVRERVNAWRAQGYPGVTRTNLELLQWWQRDGRNRRLFFTQIEAAETIIFMMEARADFRQGIQVPRDEPSEDRRAEGYAGFARYVCKMATGSGKTTVMGMLAAWSILNKVNDRSDGRFSDVVLIVCPNVTIRNRLAELDPELGEASLYRTRDLVPGNLLSLLTQGRVLVTNWHVFEPQGVQTGGVSNEKRAQVIRLALLVG